MSLMINLLNVPPSGLEIHQEVDPVSLALSPEDGIVVGCLSCEGTLLLTGEHSAHFEGNLRGRISRECVRCLARFEDSLLLMVDIHFQKPSDAVMTNKAKGKGSKGQTISLDESVPDEEVYPFTGNDIDFLPAIREHVILATPLQPLCKDNCLGLCQKCGINLNESLCGCCTPVTASTPVSQMKQALSKQPSSRSSVTVRKHS